MLKTIGNTLRDGDSKTKRILMLTFAFAAAVLLFLFAAFLFHLPGFYLFSAFSLICTLAAARRFTVASTKRGSVNSGVRSKERKTGSRTGNLAENGKNQKLEEASAVFSEEEDFSNVENPPEEEEEESTNQEKAASLLAGMTEEKLRLLFIRFKVTKEHVPVIIDLCVSERVKQCPGFAFLSEGKFKVLLLEGTPRILVRSIPRTPELLVERGASVRASSEYTELRQTTLMKKIFTPYLPAYHKKTIAGHVVLLKNLYILDGDIKFTSGSVKSLQKLYTPKFQIPFRGKDNEVNTYYRQMFESSFLWQDSIFNFADYKERVEEIITEMAMDSKSDSELDEKLSEMISDGLLPDGYRNFAYQKRREKVEGTLTNVKKRKEKRKSRKGQDR